MRIVDKVIDRSRLRGRSLTWSIASALSPAAQINDLYSVSCASAALPSHPRRVIPVTTHARPRALQYNTAKAIFSVLV